MLVVSSIASITFLGEKRRSIENSCIKLTFFRKRVKEGRKVSGEREMEDLNLVCSSLRFCVVESQQKKQLNRPGSN